jgi:hypothetical protein
MVKEIIIEFPEFITHASLSKNKWKKINYNAVYASPHFHVRNAFTNALHSYIKEHLPTDLVISGPISTEVIVYAPINYGNVKSKINKITNQREVSWKAPAKDYVPAWDIFNLAAVWLKALDDCLVHTGAIKDDNIAFFNGFGGRFIEVPKLEDRKIVYIIKKI